MHTMKRLFKSLRWRHDERDGVSYHQPHDCSFIRAQKKTLKLRVTGLCDGNSPVTGEFPTPRASNAENVSIWWRHHVKKWKTWYKLTWVCHICLMVWCLFDTKPLYKPKIINFISRKYLFICWLPGVFFVVPDLTHWGRTTHICVSKLTIIGSDNGLSPDRRQAIICANAGILLIGPLGTNFSEILIEILTFSLKKCVWKCRLRNGGHFISA